jgi:hypothetical protein
MRWRLVAPHSSVTVIACVLARLSTPAQASLSISPARMRIRHRADMPETTPSLSPFRKVDVTVTARGSNP